MVVIILFEGNCSSRFEFIYIFEGGGDRCVVLSFFASFIFLNGWVDTDVFEEGGLQFR